MPVRGPSTATGTKPFVQLTLSSLPWSLLSLPTLASAHPSFPSHPCWIRLPLYVLPVLTFISSNGQTSVYLAASQPCPYLRPRPQAPQIVELYDLNIPVYDVRVKIREQFEKNRGITDLNVYDILLLKGRQDFQVRTILPSDLPEPDVLRLITHIYPFTQETMNTWKQSVSPP